jgi:hypothetical protein
LLVPRFNSPLHHRLFLITNMMIICTKITSLNTNTYSRLSADTNQITGNAMM